MTAVLNLPQLERALAAHALMSVTDLAGDIVYANERFCTVSGYSRAELLGQNHRLLKSGVHPADFYAELWRTLRSGRIWDGLICNRRKNGDQYWVQSTIMPVQNKVGVTVRYLSLRTEVTRQIELRTGLEALVLADSACPFNDMVAAIACSLRALCVGIVRCDDESSQGDVLAEWRCGALTARTRYRLAGTPLDATLHWTSPAPHLITAVRDSFAEAGEFLVEGARNYHGVPLRERDGHTLGVLYVQDAHSDWTSDGRNALLMVAAVKATAAIAGSEDHRRLIESEARLRTLINNAPIGVFMADISGALSFVSEPLAARYGHGHDDLLGDGWLSRLTPLDAERVTNAWRQFIASDVPEFLDEYHVYATSGQIETLRTSAAPIVENGHRIGYVGTVENISNLRDLEHRLSQAQKMEALGAFTGGIAHDFNNILASILGYTGLTRHRLRVADPDTLDDYLIKVEAAVMRGKELIERLLAFSRSAPEGEQTQSILAQSAVHEACELLQSILPASMRLERDVDNEEAYIAISPVELQQVLFNLVINARDANGVHGTIALHLGQHQARSMVCSSCGAVFHGQFVEISCTDTGTGISQATLARVFEPFFTTKREQGGTGLGLAMVHGIVHKSAGHIVVESRNGHGTCVRMLFPGSLSSESTRSLPDAATVAASGRTQHVRRIMLVDDERAVIEPLTEMLNGYGHEIHSFVSPNEALRTLLEDPHAYDLLICDLIMPELTGEELAVAMRRAGLTVPIVMYSGSVDTLVVERMAELSIRALLHKPVSIPDLLRAIEQAIAAPVVV